jgi:hypothetical protein
LIKIEKRIQLAFKELLIEETWNYLKTHYNYERVLSIASLIDKYDPGPDPCYDDCSGMCFGCYDGYTFSLDWRASSNLRSKKPFSKLTDHELTMLIEAMDDKIHKCDKWCSNFICYKYTGETCGKDNCNNLFIKNTKNVKYCSVCRHNIGYIFHDHAKPLEEWKCYCKRFLPGLFYGEFSEVSIHDHWKEVKDWSCYCKHGSYFINHEARIKYYKSIGDPWFIDVEI